METKAPPDLCRCRTCWRRFHTDVQVSAKMLCRRLKTLNVSSSDVQSLGRTVTSQGVDTMSYLLSTFRPPAEGRLPTNSLYPSGPSSALTKSFGLPSTSLLTRRLEMDAMQQGIKQYLDSWT